MPYGIRSTAEAMGIVYFEESDMEKGTAMDHEREEGVDTHMGSRSLGSDRGLIKVMQRRDDLVKAPGRGNLRSIFEAAHVPLWDGLDGWNCKRDNAQCGSRAVLCWYRAQKNLKLVPGQAGQGEEGGRVQRSGHDAGTEMECHSAMCECSCACARLRRDEPGGWLQEAGMSGCRQAYSRVQAVRASRGHSPELESTAERRRRGRLETRQNNKWVWWWLTGGHLGYDNPVREPRPAHIHKLQLCTEHDK